MKKNPLVSIIINNYNYARFLNESIGSALDQSYKNIEVIVVDDGSTDRSREIILGYSDQIIPLFKENGGQGSAYNVGFVKSKGKFICNLDADDILFPEAIQKAVVLFEDESIVKVQWPLWVTDTDGIISGYSTTRWTPPEGNLRAMVLTEGPFYDFNLHTGCILRRSFLQSILPLPEQEFRNGADVYVTTLAPLFGQIKNYDKPLGTYRVHGNNNYAGKELTNERVENYITRFQTNCEVLDFYARKQGYETDTERWKRNFNYLWPHRLLLAKADIEHIVPEGEDYIVVNGDEWGKGEPVKNRKAIPFPERNGIYMGLPADDESAIAELERLRNREATHLFFWWTSFWWFDNYGEFINYIEGRYDCILKNDRLIAFDLQPKGSLRAPETHLISG